MGLGHAAGLVAARVRDAEQRLLQRDPWPGWVRACQLWRRALRVNPASKKARPHLFELLKRMSDVKQREAEGAQTEPERKRALDSSQALRAEAMSIVPPDARGR